jgi:hypothetical protein
MGNRIAKGDGIRSPRNRDSNTSPTDRTGSASQPIQATSDEQRAGDRTAARGTASSKFKKLAAKLKPKRKQETSASTSSTLVRTSQGINVSGRQNTSTTSKRKTVRFTEQEQEQTHASTSAFKENAENQDRPVERIERALDDLNATTRATIENVAKKTDAWQATLSQHGQRLDTIGENLQASSQLMESSIEIASTMSSDAAQMRADTAAMRRTAAELNRELDAVLERLQSSKK